jgi:hypothetical protein
MKIRAYLDKKRITLPDLPNTPLYVTDYLRAHDREPFYPPNKTGENTSPDTAGTSQ